MCFSRFLQQVSAGFVLLFRTSKYIFSRATYARLEFSWYFYLAVRLREMSPGEMTMVLAPQVTTKHEVHDIEEASRAILQR